MKLNTIQYGDNLEIMRGFEDDSIDLIYADPPFFTQRDWGDFDDRFEDMDAYLDFMRPRLVEMRRILKKTGNVFIHLDYKAVHYIKVMMDGIFGYKMFKDEIVWDYGHGSPSKLKLTHAHNLILVYSKTNKRTFNIDDIREPYLDRTVAGAWEDEDGNRWYHGKKSPRRMHKDGRVPADVWSFNRLPGNDHEVVNYKTQKPVALLERIVKMASNPGDLVLDPFCGSGTTLVAAHTLGRNYIGIDKNPDAIAICNERLAQNTLADQKV